jgi:glycerol-3-phosphate dehydrogenase
MSAAAPQVLILGAGINGCAIARELAINGIGVTITDRGDIASGATAYSSRLIHGGLRYLEFGEFDLVRESLEERGRLLRLAKDFVRPLELMIPVANRTGGWRSSALRFLTGGKFGAKASGSRGLWLVRMGLWLYDRYARDKTLPKRSTHRVGEHGTPPVDAASYRWLCAYWDAQVQYPERFTLALLDDARTAAEAASVPFAVLTYHHARRVGQSVELLPLRNAETTAARTVSPDLIVNATGASVDRALADLAIESPRLMGPTKGSHLITRNARLIDALGGRGIYAEAPDGRPVFVLPLGEAVLVGTTDIAFDAPAETAVATNDELDYLVATVVELFPSLGFSRDDIDFHYAGVRPLPHSDAASTAGVTRRHAIVEHAPPEADAPAVISVIGGKLTTCRALAEAVADRVLEQLNRARVASTRERPIASANLAESPIGARKLPPEGAIDDAAVRWSIRHEWAGTLDDLVERRLMLLYHPRLTRRCLRRFAEILAEEGKLAEVNIEEQVVAAVARLARHYGKQVYDD